jgi:hypothetical protein
MLFIGFSKRFKSSKNFGEILKLGFTIVNNKLKKLTSSIKRSSDA